MSINILHVIAAGLGTAAGYLESFEMRALFSLIRKTLLIFCTLGGAYVLYAVFYLHETLGTILQPLFLS
ncbi:MAG: hypothetical protein ACOYB1_02960 [Limnohabitans sp.]